MARKKTKKSRKVLVYCLCTAATAALALVVGLELFGVTDFYNKDQSTVTSPESFINYDPPTDEDKAEVDHHKEGLGNQDSGSSDGNSASKKSVTPIITSATDNGSSVEVRAYVSGIVEDGGTCSLTLTKDSQTLTAHTQGVDNVSQTICTPMSLNNVPAGTWQVSVSYSSGSSEGTSNQNTTVKVD